MPGGRRGLHSGLKSQWKAIPWIAGSLRLLRYLKRKVQEHIGKRMRYMNIKTAKNLSARVLESNYKSIIPCGYIIKGEKDSQTQI